MNVLLEKITESEVKQLARSYKLSNTGTKQDIIKLLLDNVKKSDKSCGNVSRESLINYLMFHLSQRNHKINPYTLPLYTTSDLCAMVKGDQGAIMSIVEIPESDAVCGEYTKSELLLKAKIQSLKNKTLNKKDLEFLNKDELCKVVLGGQRIIRRPYDVGNFFNHKIYANHISVLRDRDDAYTEIIDTLEFISAYNQSMLLFFDYNAIERYARYLRGLVYKYNLAAFINEENIKLISKELNSKFTFEKMSTDSTYGTVFKMFYSDLRDKPCALLKVENVDIVYEKYNAKQSKYRKIRIRRKGELVHELAIGSFLNKLRTEVPVFMYTFMGFYCSSSKQGKMCNSISDKDITSLNLYEIIDGKPLYKIKLYDLGKIVKILWYIIWGLYTAQYHFKFIHYDLHADNILVTKVASPIVCEHKLGNTKVSFTTEYVPRIIDYGMSAVTVNNLFICPMEEIRVVPNQTMEDFGLDPKRYFVGTYDIARYIKDICNEFYLESKSRTLAKQIFELFYMYFIHRAKEVIIPDDEVKELFSSKSISDFMEASTSDSEDYRTPQRATAYNLYSEPIEKYIEWVYPRIQEYLV